MRHYGGNGMPAVLLTVRSFSLLIILRLVAKVFVLLALNPDAHASYPLSSAGYILGKFFPYLGTIRNALLHFICSIFTLPALCSGYAPLQFGIAFAKGNFFFSFIAPFFFFCYGPTPTGDFPLPIHHCSLCPSPFSLSRFGSRPVGLSNFFFLS